MQDLRAKGIGEDAADHAVAGARAGELARAREILARKYRLPATTREERARRMRFLQSRGFSHEAIRRALELSSEGED